MKKPFLVNLQSKPIWMKLLFSVSLTYLTVMPAGATSIVGELESAGPEYWAIVTNSTNPHMNGPGTTTGNVAVTQTNAVLSLDSSNPFAISGNVSLATGASVSHPGQVNGQIVANQNLGSVMTDASNAATYFSGLHPTSGITAINSTATINSSAPGATNVLDVTNFNLNGSTLTLNGSASDQFIINITSGDLKLESGHIDLTGGLLPTDVLFNVEDGNLSTSGGLNNESVINGIVLVDSNGSVNMSPGLVNGELISLTSGTFQIVSGGSVCEQAPAVPEPASYLLIGSGLMGLAFGGWRRRVMRQIRD